MEKPGATPQVPGKTKFRALKARNQYSIPNVTFVKINSIGRQKLAIFILKGHALMVMFLIMNVSFQSRYIRLTDRKRSVSFLPMKVPKLSSLGLDPLG